MRISLSKRYPFSASHRLHSERLSDEENRTLFGKCNYPFGHGHNYVVEVRLCGEPDPRTGQIVERGELDRWVLSAVIDRIDHRNLNCDLKEFQDLIPTTENLALVIERWLRESRPGELVERAIELTRVRVDETAKNRFEVVSGRT